MSIGCSALNANTVTADKTALTENETEQISVNISNNSGIMGFKITVEYPIEYIRINSVTKGSVTSQGNFDHNLGLKNGVVDIIWNSVEDEEKDGTLFILGVELLKKATEDIRIKISFSKEDTFNEKWEDVTFYCNDIIISADYSEVSTGNSESGTNIEVSEIDSSQIIDAVNTSLEQNGYDNLKEVQDTDKFIKDFNESLEIITGTDKHRATDFNDIKNMYESAYEDKFVNEASNNIDSAKIQSAINETLDGFNVKSIDKLNNKDKIKFVQNIEEKLKEQYPDTPNISKDLETDKAFDIIKKLYSLSNVEKNGRQNYTNTKLNKPIIIVVFSVALIALAIGIIIKKKNKN